MRKGIMTLVESNDMPEPLIRRTYQITSAQDDVIRERNSRTRESWSAIVRDLITRGIESVASEQAYLVKRKGRG